MTIDKKKSGKEDSEIERKQLSGVYSLPPTKESRPDLTFLALALASEGSSGRPTPLWTHWKSHGKYQVKP